jgi:phosphatidylserine/phosphatidylglycerophosphate/cardiolipin synthase-like enzyme
LKNKVSFSPGVECLNDIIELIQSSDKYLDICVFTISDNRISEEIIGAFNRGIEIRIISDNEKMHDDGSDIKTLAKAGIPTKIDQSPNHMHHKYMIIDEIRVLTGSYNWTKSAAKFNQENIIITDHDEIVTGFMDNFSQLWDKSEPINTL